MCAGTIHCNKSVPEVVVYLPRVFWHEKQRENHKKVNPYCQHRYAGAVIDLLLCKSVQCSEKGCEDALTLLILQSLVILVCIMPTVPEAQLVVHGVQQGN